MWILVALGNPGSEYRETRHNVGFLVAEEMRRRHGTPRERTIARARVCRLSIGEGETIVARPQTYMNRSGDAVAALLAEAGMEPGSLLVVCDDLYLEFGLLRLRRAGSHGGHNGLRSIIDVLGTEEFARLRVGVGPVEADVDHAEFVLGPFGPKERGRLEEVVRAAADCAETTIVEGIERAMNRFNRRPAAGETGKGGAV